MLGDGIKSDEECSYPPERKEMMATMVVEMVVDWKNYLGAQSR